MKMMKSNSVPHYISSFELEEARLGQAVEKCKRELAPVENEKLQQFLHDTELLKKTLRKVRQNSINVEFALNEVAQELVNELDKKKDVQFIHNFTERLLVILLKQN